MMFCLVMILGCGDGETRITLVRPHGTNHSAVLRLLLVCIIFSTSEENLMDCDDENLFTL
jgi:hypothetical protein